MPAADLPPQPATGRFINAVHHYPLRVYFEDTDMGGVVYHANYLRYMERARSDMLEVVGIDQRDTYDSGKGVYAVTNVEIAYRRPARLNDSLMVVSKVVTVGAATCTIQQSVMHGEQQLANAIVSVAYLTPEGRPQRQPKHWIEIFTRLSRGDDIHP